MNSKNMLHILNKPLCIKDEIIDDTDLILKIGFVEECKDWRNIAHVYDMANEHIGWAHDEARTYARLFCAAPEMYKLLKDAYDEFSSFIDPDFIEKINNLLNKISLK